MLFTDLKFICHLIFSVLFDLIFNTMNIFAPDHIFLCSFHEGTTGKNNSKDILMSPVAHIRPNGGMYIPMEM